MKALKAYWPYWLFLLALIAFVRIVDFNGLYGQDSCEYLRYTKCIREFITTGANPGDYFWPLLYPIAGAALSLLIALPFALQLVSIISLVLTGIFAEKIITLVSNAEKKDVRPYVFCFIILSPYLWRSGLVVMSDSLSVFFIVAAWYYCFKYRQELKSNYFIGFVAFAAAAIGTRYAAIIVLIIPAIACLYSFARNIKWTALLVSVVIVVALAIPHILIRKHDSLGFINHEWVESWSLHNFFRNYFITDNGNATYLFYNIVYVFLNLGHPAYCFAGIVFGVLWLRRLKSNIVKPGAIMMILSVMLYALFLAGIPFQNMRFLLLSFPLIMVLMFDGYNSIYSYLKEKRVVKYIVLSIVVSIQLGLCYRVLTPFYHDNKVERTIAQTMLKHDKDTLYTFSIDGALRAYGYNGVVVDMWSNRLDTVKKHANSGLVLFNTDAFTDAWRNQNPMINWEYLNHAYMLAPVEKLPDGWVLYRLSHHLAL